MDTIEGQIFPDNPVRQGRGGIILALGIISLVLLGPICGIPAWIMGRRDLKRIKEGEIAEKDRSLTQVGFVLGIVGTFVSPIFLICSGILIAIILSLTSAHSIRDNKDEMVKDATHIARVAHEYKLRGKGAAGGGGSYEGFALSEPMKRTPQGKYYLKILSPDSLQIIGESIQREGSGLVAEVNELGFIYRWEFVGDFQPWYPPYPRTKKPPEDEKLHSL